MIYSNTTKYPNDLISFIVLFILMTMTLHIYIMFSLTTMFANDTYKFINKNIGEYNEVDRSHICNLVSCEEVIYNNKYYYLGSNKLLYVKKTSILKDLSYIELSKSINLYPTKFLLECIIYDGTHVVYTAPSSLRFVFISLVVSTIIMLMVALVFFVLYIRKVRKNDMLAFIGEKSNLQHNIVTVLSENLHHELKTPLAVISEEIKVVEESLNSSSGIVPYYSIIDAVNIIKVNTDIVFSIIETIRITKFINHSYTNSNIYGIVRYAVKMMNITNKEKIFSLEIEEGLKLYELRDLSLYNLLIILINHIKNAIEAGSTDILFHCPGTCSNDGCLTFFIIDNGRGIADNIVDKIYNLNFSTKEKLNIEDLPSRGIGLYLSRELLRQSGGDERLFSTSNSGTTFEIKIPVYEKKT